MQYQGNRFGLLPHSWWGNAVTGLPREIFGLLNELANPGIGNRWYEFPRMTLEEKENGLEVKAALPGYDPESISAEVVGDFLTVRAEKKIPELAEAERFIHREREEDSMEEVIKLPCRVTPQGIKANFRNGLLVITLPREIPAEPKNIKVSIEQ